MWTRSAANKANGKITVTCTDWNGQLFFSGEFASLAAANEAGQDAERRMTIAMNAPKSGTIISAMTDDELLTELAA